MRANCEVMEPRILLAADPTIVGPTAIDEGASYVLKLDSGGLDSAQIQRWSIDWGDGLIDTLPGDPDSASHIYPDGLARYDIRATVQTAGGMYSARPIPATRFDEGFDGDGKLAVHVGTPDQANSVGELLRQPDGKLLVIGTINAGSEWETAFVQRLLANGQPDPTFGSGGGVSQGFMAEVMGAAIAPDGQIVLAGNAGPATAVSVVARLNPDGSLDSSFGVDGRISFERSTWARTYRDVDIQSDGKILVAQAIWGDGAGFGVIRLNDDGSVDTGFGQDGWATFFEGTFSGVSEMVIEATGKIVVAGQTRMGPMGDEDYTRPAAVRFNPDGTTDTTFGQNGIILEDLGHHPTTYTDVQIGPEGTLVFSGYIVRTPDDSAFISRVVTSDSTPAAGSTWRTFLDFGQTNELLHSIAIDPHGRILAAGEFKGADAADPTLQMLVRLNGDGTADETFAAGGRILLDAGAARELVIAPDGTAALAADGMLLTQLQTGDLAVTVANVTPSFTLTGPDEGQTGSPLTIEISYADPGQDQIQAWTIDWGDQQVETIDASKLSASHTYALAGTYTVSVTTADEDGTYSVGSLRIPVVPVPVLAPDGTLKVVGMAAADEITVTIPATEGDAQVTVALRNYLFARADVKRIEIQSLAGDDKITVNLGLILPTTIDGGAGVDRLLVSATAGDDVIDLPAAGQITINGVDCTTTGIEITTVAGSDGDDLFTASVAAKLGPAVHIEGGDGVDELQFIGTESGEDFSVGGEAVTSLRLGVYQSGLEKLFVDAKGGNDTLFVTGGLPASTLILAGPGDDRLTIASTGSPFQTRIDIDGGEGVDLFRLDDRQRRFATWPDPTYTLYAQTIASSPMEGGSFGYVGVESMEVLTGLGNDTVNVVQFPPGVPLKVDTSIGADVLNLSGPGGDVTILDAKSSLNVVAGDYVLRNNPQFPLGGVNVHVAEGSTIRFDMYSAPKVAYLGIDRLQLESGAAASIAPGGMKMLELRSLELAQEARLDLNDGALRWYAGTDVDAVLDRITAFLRSGRSTADNRWLGSGIMSSAAAQNPNRGLAVRVVLQAIEISYGWNGAVNFDGKINADDYFAIDTGFLARPAVSRYSDGDFNYDGKIDADDYFLIDSAFLGQGRAVAQAKPALASFVASAPRTVFGRKSVRRGRLRRGDHLMDPVAARRVLL